MRLLPKDPYKIALGIVAGLSLLYMGGLTFFGGYQLGVTEKQRSQIEETKRELKRRESESLQFFEQMLFESAKYDIVRDQDRDFALYVGDINAYRERIKNHANWTVNESKSSRHLTSLKEGYTKVHLYYLDEGKRGDVYKNSLQRISSEVASLISDLFSGIDVDVSWDQITVPDDVRGEKEKRGEWIRKNIKLDEDRKNVILLEEGTIGNHKTAYRHVVNHVGECGYLSKVCKVGIPNGDSEADLHLLIAYIIHELMHSYGFTHFGDGGVMDTAYNTRNFSERERRVARMVKDITWEPVSTTIVRCPPDPCKQEIGYTFKPEFPPMLSDEENKTDFQESLLEYLKTRTKLGLVEGIKISSGISDEGTLVTVSKIYQDARAIRLHLRVEKGRIVTGEIVTETSFNPYPIDQPMSEMN